MIEELGAVASSVYLIGNFFRIYIIGMFFRVFFDVTAPRNRKIARDICYIVYYVGNSMCFLVWELSPNMILLSNILGCLLISVTYIGTWKHKVLATIASVAIPVVCEDLAYRLLVSLGTEHMVILGSLSMDLMFLMIVLMLNEMVDLKRRSGITFVEWIFVVLIPTCSVFVSAIALDNCKDVRSVALGGISMVLINIFVFYLLDRIQEMHKKQMDLALLEQQNQAYENQMALSKESERNITALRHDMKNHLLSLQQLIRHQQYQEAKTYLSDLFTDLETKHRFVATGNTIVDGLLNIKLGQAAEMGVDILTDIQIPTELSMNLKDFSILMGNLLDNALRALEQCEKKKYLKVVMKEELGKFFISVENSHCEEFKKVGNVFLTTKGEWRSHGIGLKNVRRVVDQYDGEMNIETTNSVFSTKLIMFV